MDFLHKPVLFEEVIHALAVRPRGVYVDGTVGGAGHAGVIARRLAGGLLIAIDKDPDALAVAEQRLKGLPVRLIQDDFANIPAILDREGIERVDGILLDLGVSSHQLDTVERGFSYHQDAPLDMRMSQQGKSAYDVVNSYEEEELRRIFYQYGEEKFAPRIARSIVDARKEAPIQTTGELVELIKKAIPAAARRTGGHPAKRVFQAIRIEVNDELQSLSVCLDEAFERIVPGGRFVVITFHSLEDRMVKKSFQRYCTGCTCPPDFPVCVCGKTPRAKEVHRKIVTASSSELAENPRSRSAKMRAVEKM